MVLSPDYAFGYDPEEDIPYKPQLFGGLGNPKLIDIEESKLSEETLQFELEPEFFLPFFC